MSFQSHCVSLHTSSLHTYRIVVITPHGMILSMSFPVALHYTSWCAVALSVHRSTGSCDILKVMRFRSPGSLDISYRSRISIRFDLKQQLPTCCASKQLTIASLLHSQAVILTRGFYSEFTPRSRDAGDGNSANGEQEIWGLGHLPIADSTATTVDLTSINQAIEQSADYAFAFYVNPTSRQGKRTRGIM